MSNLIMTVSSIDPNSKSHNNQLNYFDVIMQSLNTYAQESMKEKI